MLVSFPPTPTSSSPAILTIACGDGQTIAITTSGKVYGWGCYKDKEGKKFFHPSEGSSQIRRQQDTPLLLSGIESAIDVACGSSFNLIRCEDGSLYSFGMSECGELGRILPPVKRNEEYVEEDILKHYLTPGFMYTGLLTASGSLVQATHPVRDAKAIGCGAYHSLVVVVNPLSSRHSYSHFDTFNLLNYS